MSVRDEPTLCCSKDTYPRLNVEPSQEQVKEIFIPRPRHRTKVQLPNALTSAPRMPCDTFNPLVPRGLSVLTTAGGKRSMICTQDTARVRAGGEGAAGTDHRKTLTCRTSGFRTRSASLSPTRIKNLKAMYLASLSPFLLPRHLQCRGGEGGKGDTTTWKYGLFPFLPICG